MSDNATNNTAAPTSENNNAQAKATFELPEEDARTALKENDRKLVVDLRTGDILLEPIARNRLTENLILVCLDPSKKKGTQSDVSYLFRHICVTPMGLLSSILADSRIHRLL